MCRALLRSAVKRVSVNLTQSEERWEHACEALCVEVAVEKEETIELDSDMSDLAVEGLFSQWPSSRHLMSSCVRALQTRIV